MQQIDLPTALTEKDWLAKVTAPIDKPTKIGDLLAGIEVDFKKLGPNLKLMDFSDLDTKEDFVKRRDEFEAKVVKPLLILADSLKKVESAVKAAQDSLKKAGKDGPAKALLSAIASFGSAAKSEPAAGVKELKALEDVFALKGESKVQTDTVKKVTAHNARVKKYIRDLRSGNFPSFPFAFAQNKTREPYKKGKPWGAKSLAHVGPKAVKSFKTQFETLLDKAPFIFSFGELRYSLTGKDAKKLVFMFESPLANPKQLKDALLFQIGFAPPLKLRKDTGEEIEEAGEGEDLGEDLGDVTDEDEPDTVGSGPLVLTPAQKKTFQDALALPGDAPKLIKRKIDEAQALAKTTAGAAKAKVLIAEAEVAAKALIAKAAATAKAAPAGVAADVAERIRTAKETWAASSTAAEKGIDKVMLELNKMFVGDAGQAPKVKNALRTLNNLKPKLKSDLGSKLDQAAKEANESRRLSLIKEAIAAATQVEKRISDDPIMGELDGANNDVLPGVNIIGPMKSALGAIRALA